MTVILPATPTKRLATPRVRLVFIVAAISCVVGYAGFIATIIALKAEMLSVAQSLMIGGVFGVVGEVGLWVAAASLGIGFYVRRKEKLARAWSGFVARFKKTA